MDAYRVVPGQCVGQFHIGAYVSDVLHYLKRHPYVLGPCEFRFEKTDPISAPYVLRLAKLGMSLFFSSQSQRLDLIAIDDFAKLDLDYSSKVFSSPHRIPSFLAIHTMFGPTAAGHYSKSRDHFELYYPGITFGFNIPEEVRMLENIQLGKMPEHDSVLLTTLFVYKSDPERPQRFQALQSTSHPAPMFVVNPSQGISFLGDIALSFGDSAQDTISVLGDPSHVSLKTQDPLSIHSGVKLNAHQPDYFFNYYPLGVDILFDSSTHTIKKFILRTNLPSSAYFDLYRKCHFHIVPPPKKDAIKRINEGDKIVESDEEGDEAKYKAQVIDSDMKWPRIREIYGENHSDPFFLPSSPDSPFEGSKYYAYRDIIFEITEGGCLATVTLFYSPNQA